jgi:hypothetical protein
MGISRKPTSVRVATLVSVAAVAVLTGACGSSVAGNAKAGEIDIRTLDIGRYSTDPREISTDVSPELGRLLEGARMGDAVALVADIDPKFEYSSAQIVKDPQEAADALSLIETPVIKPVLEKYGMIVGFGVSGLDGPLEQFELGRSSNFVMVVNRFPSDDVARQAAVEIDAADFAVSADNAGVPIPRHPDAKAHWRPGHQSIGATQARGPFVISVFAVTPTPNLDELSERVAKILDTEVALLDKFTPTPVDKLTTLPVDEDNLVSKVLVTPGEEIGVGDYANFGPHAGLHFQPDKHYKDRLLQNAGLERLASYQGFPALFRVRDANAATDLVPLWTAAVKDSLDGKDLEAKTDVPGTQCVESDKPETEDAAAETVFICTFAYQNYMAMVQSDTADDVARRVAAQYSLLAKS